MKTMTCRELGSACDVPLSAETWQGMAALMMNHIREKHPVVAQNMEEDDWRSRRMEPGGKKGMGCNAEENSHNN
jgi:predicted small metal-binding protein